MVFFTALNTVSVTSQRQLIYSFISCLSPGSGSETLEYTSIKKKKKKDRGSSLARTQDLRVTCLTLYHSAKQDLGYLTR